MKYFKLKKCHKTVQVYVSGPWENIYMAVVANLLIQIANKINLSWPYLTYLASPTLTLPVATFPSP